MNVAIVGLGLIGGSMAKSIKNRAQSAAREVPDIAYTPQADG